MIKREEKSKTITHSIFFNKKQVKIEEFEKIAKTNFKKKKKSKNLRKKKKRPPRCTSWDGSKNVFVSLEIVTRNRAAIEASKMEKQTKPWTPKVALRPSGVLVFWSLWLSVWKQSAMSKRGQKRTSNEGSPMAKATPSLVAREQRSDDISHNATAEQRGRYQNFLYLRAFGEDSNGPPSASRLGYQELKNVLKSMAPLWYWLPMRQCTPTRKHKF